MGRWNLAVMAILIAAVLDGMDGRLARMLNSTSRFGAELDSLSDFISFGVSPALVIYLRSLQEWHGIGWIIALYFAVCMALRLARFNTLSIEGTTPPWAQYFFMGVPAPAGAILILTPLMIHFEFEERGWGNLFISPTLNAIVVFITASLLISRIPTLSLKKVQISHKLVLPLLVIVALLTGALFSEPWMTLSAIAIIYILSIPFTVRACRRKTKIEE
jgi:CDP-diacylglycerol--serine O-phosphatidyltransferase